MRWEEESLCLPDFLSCGDSLLLEPNISCDALPPRYEFRFR